MVSLSPSGFGPLGGWLAAGRWKTGTFGARGVDCSIVSNRRLVKARYYCTLPLENNEDGQRVGDQGFVPLASIHSQGAKLRLLRDA